MSQSFGTFGSGAFGGDAFGLLRELFAVTGTLATPELTDLFSQVSPRQFSPSVFVVIDGINVSGLVTKLSTKLVADGSTSMADITINTDFLSVYAHKSVVSIFVNYLLPSGALSQMERFRGIVYKVEAPLEGANQDWKIQVFDMFYALTEGKPRTVATWKDWANTYFDQELEAWGIGALAGNFAWFIPTKTINPQNFSTAREYLYAILNGRRKTQLYLMPSGWAISVDVMNTIGIQMSGWTIHNTAQTKQKFFYDSQARYNRVAFSPSGYIYNDTNDQASHGIMPHPGLNSAFYDYDIPNGATDADKAILKAANNTTLALLGKTICDDSHRERVEFEIATNPCLFPGTHVYVQRKSGAFAVVRLESAYDDCSPAGFWSTYSGRVIS